MNEQSRVCSRKAQQGKEEKPNSKTAEGCSRSLGGGAGASVAEEWRPVVGYKGIYEVSNLGVVRSVDRVRDHGCRGLKRRLRGKVIKGWVNCKGYKMVAMSKNGRVIKKSIHMIVCDAFYPRARRECVNHKNGIKLDNRADNIEPSTYSKNNLHAYDIGLKSRIGKKGEDVGTSKLTVADVLMAREYYNGERGQFATLARKLRVSETTITRAIKGVTWNHI